MIAAVGSKNLVKVKAVEDVAIEIGIEVVPVSVSSGVSPQPMSDLETKQGAVNRAQAALKATSSDIGIGLEGGVMKLGAQWFVCNWGALVDSGGMEIVGSGSRFPIPEMFMRSVLKGKELGDVVDAYTKGNGVGRKEGAVGVLTNGFVTRKKLYDELSNLLFGQYFFYRKKML